MVKGKSAGGEPSSEEAKIALKNTAKNIISKGICSACNSEKLDIKVVGIQCWWCKLHFHGTGCVDECNVSGNSDFTKQLRPAVTNDGKFDGRFGRFLFVCDYCMTCKEKEAAQVNTDRVDLLEKKFDTMQNELRNEILEFKNLLTQQSSTTVVNTNPSSNAKLSPWNDTQKVNRLKQMLVIKKTSDGTPICVDELEKICVDNKISVHKTTTLEKSKDTSVLLNSRKDVDVLMEKIGEKMPGHVVEMKQALKPTISIVGLNKGYTQEDLLGMIKNQNCGISTLMNDKSANIDDKYIDIINVSEIKSYQGTSNKLCKAVVRVSNLIRSIIANQGNRVFVGNGTCKVYDSFYVMRCFNCQQFGCHSNKCEKDPVCGFCAEGHQTQHCTTKDSNNPTCINCKQEGKDHCHAAWSIECPILKSKQTILKKKIPFYQNADLETPTSLKTPSRAK